MTSHSHPSLRAPYLWDLDPDTRPLRMVWLYWEHFGDVAQLSMEMKTVDIINMQITCKGGPAVSVNRLK